MDRADEYGWIGADYHDVAAQVSSRLGLEMHSRWSDERGGYYLSTAVGATPGISIMRNFEDEDGVLLKEDHPELTVILDSSDLTDVQGSLLEELGGILLGRYIK